MLDWLADSSANREVVNGLNNGKGERCADGSFRGMIKNTGKTNPHLGKLGMFQEFQDADGGGTTNSSAPIGGGIKLSNARSCLLYGLSAPRMLVDVIAVMVAYGAWDAKAYASIRDRLNVGHLDVEWKLSPTGGGGYVDRANGGPYGQRSTIKYHSGTGATNLTILPSGTSSDTIKIWSTDAAGPETIGFWKEVLYPATAP